MHLSTKLIVLIHNRETRRPTNTGRLATLALPHSELRVRGLRTPMNEEGLVVSDRQTLLLYPDENAVELSPSYVASFKKPITLIVPDGSWRQAAKMRFRVPALKDVPHVKIPMGAKSNYQLRQETKENGLATFEAIARAFGIIESPEVQQRLEDFFKIMVERTMWSRGKKLAEDCESPIPPEAILFNSNAGHAGSR